MIVEKIILLFWFANIVKCEFIKCQWEPNIVRSKPACDNHCSRVSAIFENSSAPDLMCFHDHRTSKVISGNRNGVICECGVKVVGGSINKKTGLFNRRDLPCVPPISSETILGLSACKQLCSNYTAFVDKRNAGKRNDRERYLRVLQCRKGSHNDMHIRRGLRAIYTRGEHSNSQKVFNVTYCTCGVHLPEHNFETPGAQTVASCKLNKTTQVPSISSNAQLCNQQTGNTANNKNLEEMLRPTVNHLRNIIHREEKKMISDTTIKPEFSSHVNDSALRMSKHKNLRCGIHREETKLNISETTISPEFTSHLNGSVLRKNTRKNSEKGKEIIDHFLSGEKTFSYLSNLQNEIVPDNGQNFCPSKSFHGNKPIPTNEKYKYGPIKRKSSDIDVRDSEREFLKASSLSTLGQNSGNEKYYKEKILNELRVPTKGDPKKITNVSSDIVCETLISEKKINLKNKIAEVESDWLQLAPPNEKIRRETKLNKIKEYR